MGSIAAPSWRAPHPPCPRGRSPARRGSQMAGPRRSGHGGPWTREGPVPNREPRPSDQRRGPALTKIATSRRPSHRRLVAPAPLAAARGPEHEEHLMPIPETSPSPDRKTFRDIASTIDMGVSLLVEAVQAAAKAEIELPQQVSYAMPVLGRLPSVLRHAGDLAEQGQGAQARALPGTPGVWAAVGLFPEETDAAPDTEGGSGE